MQEAAFQISSWKGKPFLLVLLKIGSELGTASGEIDSPFESILGSIILLISCPLRLPSFHEIERRYGSSFQRVIFIYTLSAVLQRCIQYRSTKVNKG